jgi:hypothetical protein
MALATPIEMPVPLRVKAKTFDLDHMQNISPVGAGFIQSIDRGPPMWYATYTTPELSPDAASVFQAFLDELEGSHGTFLAYDPRKPRPLSSMAVLSGEPWVQTGQPAARVINADYNAGTLQLDRLENGYVLRAGDYISFQRSNAWYLHRVKGSGATVASNGATVSVVPRPQTNTADVTARLTRACCAMKMIGKPEVKDDVEQIGPMYTFNGVQFIDRS